MTTDPALPQPPVAPRRPTTLTHHGDDRTDDWFWLRDRDDPAVIAHLEAENAFTKSVLADQAPLRSAIFEEIRGRVRETDASAPVRFGPWEYFTRTREGLQYPVHCRRPLGATGLPDPDAEPGSEPGEVVLLDENVEAGDGYFGVGAFDLDPDQELLAWSSDRTGAERYDLHVRDLASGTDVDGPIPGTYYGTAWAGSRATGDACLFSVRTDEAERPFQVWRHRLGTDPALDECVFEEPDERFFVGVERTRSGDLVVITSGSKITSEAWTIPTATPMSAPVLVSARREGVEYHVDHHRGPDGGSLYLVTNDDAVNFRVMVTPTASPDRSHWSEVVAHRDDARVEAVDCFAGHLVVSERSDGLEQIRVVDLADGGQHVVALPDAVYTVGLGSTPEYDTTVVRIGYASLVTPSTAFDYDLVDRRLTLVKRQPVAGYDPERFTTHREWATADDGTRIPISIVAPRDAPRDGTAPLLLYGYGSYEISMDPGFSVARLSLLERGVVYAIAHIRGGGELGRAWYDDGKLLHKRNTFTDFVACARHLVDGGWSSPGRMAARGGSAGGLLMGAVVNLAPAAFAAVVAEVPFVDCLTTILDPSLPLTVTEWEEWGNPLADSGVYDYMKSYSPYDNVAPVDHPAILVTAGLNDPRVQYWEPAKWVAKLRAVGTGDRPVLLRTEMGAGHSGPSGRYDAWRDEALVLAFVCDRVGAAGRIVPG